jgi:hypothetical protein
MLFPDQEKIMTVEDRGSGRFVPEPVDALIEELRSPGSPESPKTGSILRTREEGSVASTEEVPR